MRKHKFGGTTERLSSQLLGWKSFMNKIVKHKVNINERCKSMTQNDSMADLKQQALVDINEAQNERELQDVKVKYLGKKAQ